MIRSRLTRPNPRTASDIRAGSGMGREGLEPSTDRLKADCSTN